MLSQQRVGGEIVLVGAGPGDPDLITLRGLRAIQSADVLMYDKLIDPGLLEYARRDVELVDVGKQGPREDGSPCKMIAASLTCACACPAALLFCLYVFMTPQR